MPCRVCDCSPTVARGLCRKCYLKHWEAKTLQNYPLKKLTLEARFMRFFNRSVRTESGCIEWPGRRKTGKFPYGVITIEIPGKGSKIIRAHRVSYSIHKGPIPEGMNVLHTCDNPPCVNPDHLFLGTRDDNNKDCKAKGRNIVGARHWRAKFTDEDIVFIRKSSLSAHELAQIYNVVSSTITRIRSGSRWAHMKRKRAILLE